MAQKLAGRLTLGDHAYEMLRDGIISLAYEPGSMVYENELALTLSMSRTPIREAFRKLAVEDFIEVLPQRGVRISQISERKVREARFVRESLEVSAIRQLAATWHREGTIYLAAEARAGELLKQQKEAAHAHDPQLFLQLDEAFHELLLELTGNRTLIGVISHMRGHLNRVRSLMLRELNHYLQVVGEHERIVEAVTSGHVDRAGDLMRDHLAKLSDDYPDIANKFPGYFKP